MKSLKLLFSFLAGTLFLGCSQTTVVESVQYTSPHIVPSGSTLLVLRSEYKYVSTTVIFWMVESNETPVSLSWFIEHYDMQGNKLDEAKIGSADSVYLSENEWTICAASDSIAVLQANGWPRSPRSLLYTITSKSLSGLSDSVNWKNGVIDRDQGRYYVINRNWSSKVSELQSIHIQDGTSTSIATMSDSFEYISPSLPANGDYCVVWGDGIIGRFWFSNSMVQSWQLNPPQDRATSVFCFGDNNIAYVLSPDTVVFSSWQGDSLVRYDRRALGLGSASDVMLDSAGTTLAFRDLNGVTDDGRDRGSIALHDMKTGKEIIACQDKEKYE